jgi:hypothetical protein
MIFDQGEMGKDKVVERLVLFVQGNYNGQSIFDRPRVMPYRLFFCEVKELAAPFIASTEPLGLQRPQYCPRLQ